MTALTIVAPTDAQLGYIADLCRKQGLAPPQAIHSAQEASAIIDAIRAARMTRRGSSPMPTCRKR